MSTIWALFFFFPFFIVFFSPPHFFSPHLFSHHYYSPSVFFSSTFTFTCVFGKRRDCFLCVEWNGLDWTGPRGGRGMGEMANIKGFFSFLSSHCLPQCWMGCRDVGGTRGTGTARGMMAGGRWTRTVAGGCVGGL
ncbi:hypothetical protein BZA05DRAFT_258612 [Tricharina praecox]|uniref:uncharacterized protein n=1 Tax=Tricharina praecox TaxID=43433 RepID=UPI002220DF3A|nr:uncharacterized protein BZA05DRAFT_258612 [Tricharina praecox]KAI5854133.1 hypothetical protein BZA05DRAFT_258612 [Tricharina praecox]